MCAAQHPLSIVEQCQLAHGHTVDDRNLAKRPEPVEEFIVGDEAIHVISGYWIWPVEYHNLDAVFSGRLHHKTEDVDMLIEACPDFLNVEHNYIHTFKHFVGRFMDAAVKRMFWQARFGIGITFCISRKGIVVTSDVEFHTEEYNQI